MNRQILGVDLDNTIICYDQLFHRLAVERGLVQSEFRPSKKLIRDEIRALPNGDAEWQKLQAEAYGPRIGQASVFPGVRAFFEAARERGARPFIVSHKTSHASFGDPDLSLRTSAVSFLLREGLLKYLQGGEADVFFEDTRQDKCRRIGSLDCSLFVDDLLETFQESEFPAKAERLLFDPLGVYTESVPERRFSSWKAIAEYVFD